MNHWVHDFQGPWVRGSLPAISGALLSVFICVGCGGGTAPREAFPSPMYTKSVFVEKRLLFEDTSIGLIKGMFQIYGTGDLVIVGWEGTRQISVDGAESSIDNKPTHIPVSEYDSLLMPHGYIQTDFDDDGVLERLRPTAGGFAIESSNGVTTARTIVGRPYWYKPYVTWSEPRLVLVSTDGSLLVYDGPLQLFRELPTPGMAAPLHIAGGAALGRGKNAPFVSVFVGRGGWHKSVLLIHSTDDRLIYREVLPDDCMSVWPMPMNAQKCRFFLSGRGQVWEYMLNAE